MGKYNPNPAQLEAIAADNKKILISAGAGTGKSGTMAERVIRLITEGKANLLDMLVITFTNDAAESIRDKINNALRAKLADDPDNNVIRRNVTCIPASHISTIHSFCSDIVRNAASRLDIDSNYRIMETVSGTHTFMMR